MSKTAPRQTAARPSQTSDVLPRCNHRPAPASPPWLMDRPSSATPSTPPAKLDAPGPRTCLSDRQPPSKLPSTPAERQASPPVPLHPLGGRDLALSLYKICPSLHRPRLLESPSQYALAATPPPPPHASQA